MSARNIPYCLLYNPWIAADGVNIIYQKILIPYALKLLLQTKKQGI